MTGPFSRKNCARWVRLRVVLVVREQASRVAPEKVSPALARVRSAPMQTVPARKARRQERSRLREDQAAPAARQCSRDAALSAEAREPVRRREPQDSSARAVWCAAGSPRDSSSACTRDRCARCSVCSNSAAGWAWGRDKVLASPCHRTTSRRTEPEQAV